MVKIGKVKNTLTDYARDGLAIAFSGTVAGVASVVGGVISIVVSPKIAKTNFGKNFNRLFALVLTVDAALEYITPKGVM